MLKNFHTEMLLIQLLKWKEWELGILLGDRALAYFCKTLVLIPSDGR
jgi:hypothetical protein